MSTAPTTPFPFLTPEMLRSAHATLTGSTAARKIGFDGNELGVTATDGTPVETVWVTMRDLEFIHALDPARFGGHKDCPFCVAEQAQMEEAMDQ